MKFPNHVVSYYMEKITCFSVVTGKIFDINEDEKDTLTSFQLVLTRVPDKNCPKCFGRMHIGKNIQKGFYEICPKCLSKCIDFKDMRKRFGNKNEKI